MLLGYNDRVSHQDFPVRLWLSWRTSPLCNRSFGIRLRFTSVTDMGGATMSTSALVSVPRINEFRCIEAEVGGLGSSTPNGPPYRSAVEPNLYFARTFRTSSEVVSALITSTTRSLHLSVRRSHKAARLCWSRICCPILSSISNLETEFDAVDTQKCARHGWRHHRITLGETALLPFRLVYCIEHDGGEGVGPSPQFVKLDIILSCLGHDHSFTKGGAAGSIWSCPRIYTRGGRIRVRAVRPATSPRATVPRDG